jgi:N utilization substance protein B
MTVLFRRIEESDIPDAYHEFAYDLVMEVFENCSEVDNIIMSHAPSWPLHQMAVVDRNVLRLAITEIKWSKGIPHGVAVNEAVELAKTFGSEMSPRFVNGVLGSWIGS